MAVVGVRCVRGDIDMEEHLRCQREEPGPPCGIAPTVLNMITRPKLERQGVVFSPSSIQSCHRQRSLQVDYSWYIDVEKTYMTVRGDIIHEGLRQQPAPPGVLGVVRELRMHSPIETDNGLQRFSGQVDEIMLLSVDDAGVLHVRITDWKSKSDIAHSLLEPDRRHVYQINQYAYLVAHELLDYLRGWEWNDPPHTGALLFLNPEGNRYFGAGGLIQVQGVSGIEVDEIAIVYLSGNKVRTFTSAAFLWTKGKMKGETGTDGKWHAFVPHQYEELELAPLRFFQMQYTAELIKHGIEEQIAGDEQLAPPLAGDDARLMCPSCPVRQDCYTIGLSQGYDMRDQRPYIGTRQI